MPSHFPQTEVKKMCARANRRPENGDALPVNKHLYLYRLPGNTQEGTKRTAMLPPAAEAQPSVNQSVEHSSFLAFAQLDRFGSSCFSYRNSFRSPASNKEVQVITVRWERGDIGVQQQAKSRKPCLVDTERGGGSRRLRLCERGEVVPGGAEKKKKKEEKWQTRKGRIKTRKGSARFVFLDPSVFVFRPCPPCAVFVFFQPPLDPPVAGCF